MINIEICETNQQWSRFTEFYVAHHKSIIRGYKVTTALTDVKNTIRNGRGAILTDETDQVIGIGSFVLGLEEKGFDHKEIAVLGNSCFAEGHRGNRTFIRGLQVLAEQIAAANPDVQEVRIPTAVENGYTNRLYSKFADIIDRKDTMYGPFHIYSTSYDAFAAFCGRFRQDRQRSTI